MLKIDLVHIIAKLALNLAIIATVLCIAYVVAAALFFG